MAEDVQFRGRDDKQDLGFQPEAAQAKLAYGYDFHPNRLEHFPYSTPARPSKDRAPTCGYLAVTRVEALRASNSRKKLPVTPPPPINPVLQPVPKPIPRPALGPNRAGHGALSDYRIVNDVLGLVLHASVLTPYHAWATLGGLHIALIIKQPKVLSV
ncbi:hypothetical protein F5876DRAFT_70960 [Lentinula aff. lateritia]|uniref:Uncharacterized protein n=1 Tax=Lentinula aff. lateritia TaxID=2804960 RepID=A0ACC1THH0_9AGAR|nr:hypothetical protein F5876DRAFT_70960 [Lentinula aff. lateritia]